jgi:8-oxo-dGTP pyrophosphatase MutT (NUDIX family)
MILSPIRDKAAMLCVAAQSLLVKPAKPCFKIKMKPQPPIHPVTGETLPPAVHAATMVIFRNDPAGGAPKLLMVERIKAMAFAGGAAVFPGGKVDNADREFAAFLDCPLDIDEVAARLAAIRETLEEAGLALGLHGVSDPSACIEARAALHAGQTLQAVCDVHGWTPDLARLIPWARWRPPNLETRIFDTRFYLVNAGDTVLNAVVDQTENHSLFWASAAEVLDMSATGKVKVIFPTRRNLERLALFNSYHDAAAHAADHPVRTVLTYVEERDGEQWLCIPDGHGYPIKDEPIRTALRG